MPEQVTSTQDQINSNKSELWGLNLKDLFYKYLRFLPVFLLSVAIALLLAFIYLRYSTRIYSATGTMLIKSEQRSASNDKVEDILLGGNRTQNIQNEIELLKSRPLMERVVKRLGLQFTYIAKGKVKDFNVYREGPFLIDAFELADSSKGFTLNIKFVSSQKFTVNSEGQQFSFGQLFQNKYGVFRLNNINPASSGSEYTVTWQPSDNVAGSLLGGLSVQPKTPGTGILTINFQSTNSQMAADIVNHLMVEYDSITVEQNNYSTDQILGFITGRLQILDRELDTLQMNLIDYREKYNLIDVQAQSGMRLEKITAADKSITEQQASRSVARMIADYLLDRGNRYSKVIVPSSLGLQDLTLNEMVSIYNKAQLDRQSLLQSNIPPDNPAVKEAESQIENIRGNLIENLNNIINSYDASIRFLQGTSSAEESKLKLLPGELQQFVELERQVNTKLALYQLLEGKREEAAITRASTISNSDVIDRARSSKTPVKPQKRTIQLLAVLIGIGIPAIGIFLSEILNDKITTRLDIEKYTQAPILGEIGHSFSENTLIVNKVSRSMVAEQFRMIRTNLQYVLQKEKSVILVTSSYSGEGKSFVSTNMAGVIALTGKKTLILEFDIRKPKVLSGLNMAKRPGITNYLLGKADLPDLIIPVEGHEHMFILACGPIPPNPSEMLLEEKVTELFTWARENFDVVLIDTAPVGMVSDAMTLSKFADCTLYLVRQGHTFKKQVTLIDELYRENKLPKVSIVINDVKIKPGYGYYGSGRYGYGYGYGYGSGYYEEEKPAASGVSRFFKNILPKRLHRRIFRS